MENPIKMDDLGVALFLETPICKKDNQWIIYFVKEHAIEVTTYCIYTHPYVGHGSCS